MKITLSFARQLQQLSTGQSVAFASFQRASRRLLEQFVKDEILEVEHIGTQQRKVCCVNFQNFTSYLHHKFEILELDKYIEFLLREEGERSDAVKAVSSSKHKKRKVFTGFLVNAYEEIQCTLNNQEFVIKPQQGTFQFIYDFRNFSIPVDITVVGVEGHENFREIRRQRHLFANIRPLFVWRYQNSTAIADWLANIPNGYLHFGDFDPKGLHIYTSEFRNKIGAERCEFFVPEEFEALIARHGVSELFEKQEKYLSYLSGDFELGDLVQTLRKYRKSLDRRFLSFNTEYKCHPTPKC